MTDDFNKLDSFMRQHVPVAAPGIPPALPDSKKIWIPLGSFVAAAFVVLMVTGVYVRDNDRNDQAYAFMQTMDWDSEVETESEDISDFVAMVE